MIPYLKAVLYLAVAVCLTAASVPAGTPVTSQPTSTFTVAVLDFETSSTANPDMGKQIAEALTAELSAEDGFTLVDRSSLSRTLQEHALSLTGLTKPDDAVQIGHLAGAKLLVTGKVFVLDKSIYVTAKIIGTETSLVDGVLVKDGEDASIGTLVTKLSAKLAEHIRTKGPRLTAVTESVDPIPALKARLAGRKLPKIAISLDEAHYSPSQTRPIDPAVATELVSVLKRLGFEVVDGGTPNLADQGVDQVIKGEAFSEFAARVGDLVSCSARAEIKLTDRKSGSILFTDRVTARAADLSDNIAGKTALQKAGHELGVRLGQHYVDQVTTEPAK